jgi:hypothetical protein
MESTRGLRLSSKKSVGCPRQKGYFLIGHH